MTSFVYVGPKGPQELSPVNVLTIMYTDGEVLPKQLVNDELKNRSNAKPEASYMR